MGLNGSSSVAACDAAECDAFLAIPDARLGDAEAALNWVHGTSGWRVVGSNSFCGLHAPAEQH
jgi:hypothetical protein